MNIPPGLDDLTQKLEQLGCRISFRIDVELPPFPQEHLPPEPLKPAPTIRTVMWALNKLVAAPGQPNRELVRRFLFFRGWIGATEEPEAWNLEHVPTSKEAVIKLAQDLVQFEQDQHQPAPQPPADCDLI